MRRSEGRGAHCSRPLSRPRDQPCLVSADGWNLKGKMHTEKRTYHFGVLRSSLCHLFWDHFFQAAAQQKSLKNPERKESLSVRDLSPLPPSSHHPVDFELCPSIVRVSVSFLTSMNLHKMSLTRNKTVSQYVDLFRVHFLKDRRKGSRY